jgi:rhizoxin synthesis polyketide synthase RhiE
MANNNNSFIVTGYSLRAPNCSNVPEFAKALAEQRDLTTEVPSSSLSTGKRQGRLNPEDFESCTDHADFFGIDKDEKKKNVELCLFYQVLYEAVLDAGVSIKDLENDSTTGVYIVVDNGRCSSNTTTDNDDDVHIAKRICDHWNMCGPCFTLDIHVDACSPLKSLDRAVKDLHTKRIKRAIVGAVSLFSSSTTIATTSRTSHQQQEYQPTISPTGHCYSFDKRANGICMAEGVVCLVLERGARDGYGTTLKYIP